MRVPHIVTYTVKEKGMEYTMMQALELLGLAKRHVSGRSDIEQWRIKPVAIAIIELSLSEGISKGVSELAENSTK